MELNDATLPEDVAQSLVRAAFSQDEADTSLLTSALSSLAPRARVLALRGLARQRRLTDEHLGRALSDDADEVIHEALALLAHESELGQGLTGQLLELLGHANPLVVEAAIFAAGERELAEALEPLIDLVLTHDDARCRESGVVALGQLAVDEAKPAILSAMKDKPTVRRRAVVALASFEGDDIEEALDQASEDRDWQVRSAVEQLRRDED